MTLSIMTFGITTFSTMPLSIMGLFEALGINDTQHNNTVILCCEPLCLVSCLIYSYTKCHNADVIKLNVVMLSAIGLSVVAADWV